MIDRKPIKVEANIHNRRHQMVQVEDVAEGIVEFEDDFLLSFYTMNYFTFDAPIQITIHCEKGTAKIIGDEGYIDYKDGRNTAIKLLDEDKIDYGEGVKRYWGYCHYLEIEKIYDAIMNNKEVEVSGKECLHTQKLINSIYESGDKNGEVVEI